MSIVDELKKLIIARGGSVADAVRVLVAIEEENNDEPETP